MLRRLVVCCGLLLLLANVCPLFAAEPESRKPKSDEELRYWLENMAWHRYSTAEMSVAIGMDEKQVQETLSKHAIDVAKPKPPVKHDKLVMLPYPGGRHPRIGFLDGAINPQRETKISVFTPWDETSYVVIDVPEALWSNLGLTYLAHTHIDTVWTKQKVELTKQEWERHKDGSLSLERKLPNGIVYKASAKEANSAIEMQLSLTNGTKEKLSDLRVQNCVMLKQAKGFAQQTNDNKRFAAPLVAVRNEAGDKWIISAWQRCHNAWGNAPCPCLHSDPKFVDLAPGESQTIKGWLWFYEGKEIDKELARLNKVVSQ